MINVNLKFNSTYLYNFLFENMGVVPPNLSFLFVENAGILDMVIPVAVDSPSIILMCKNTPQKSDKRILLQLFYCIGIKFISFVHYKTRLILDDSIFDLYDVDPLYVITHCDFVLDGQIVNMEIFPKENRHLLKCYIRNGAILINPLISEFIRKEFGTVAHTQLGYYIKSNNYDYIHCFKKCTKVFKSDAIRMIDYRDPQALNYILSSEVGSFYKLIQNEIGIQIKQLEIAQLILCCCMEIFFKTSL